jgi:hypothetical protein
MGSTDSTGILTQFIRLAARIWGTLILVFVSFLLVASAFGEWGEGLPDLRELLIFLMFP